MYHPSQGLKQIAARKAELLAESKGIRTEMQSNAAALLPVISTVEMGMRLARGITNANKVLGGVAGVYRAFKSS
jgi:hypothetical protein